MKLTILLVLPSLLLAMKSGQKEQFKVCVEQCDSQVQGCV